MPVYVWKGRTTAGEIQTGELTLESQEEALAALRKRRIIISSVREKKAEMKFSMPKLGGGVTTRDLAIFTRQFATMINAGLSLLRALTILTEQTENAYLAQILGEVRNDVETGNSLSGAIHPSRRTIPVRNSSGSRCAAAPLTEWSAHIVPRTSAKWSQ